MTPRDDAIEGCGKLVATVARLEVPDVALVQAMLGDLWSTTQRDAGREHHLAPGHGLRGVRSLSLTEFLLSARDLAQVSVYLTDDAFGVQTAREVRALFGPWELGLGTFPLGASGSHEYSPTMPLCKAGCTIRPGTRLTITSCFDGRFDAIHVRWARPQRSTECVGR